MHLHTEMDFEFASFPVLFSFFLFIFMVILITRKSKSKNLPPGPWKLPIIGNIHNLDGGLPHHSFYNLSKKYGPLVHLQLGEVTTVLISSPEVAKEVMKTHDINFSNRPRRFSSEIISYESADLVFSPYGDYWRQLRKVCMLEVLSAKRVQSFRSIREEEVSKVLISISDSEGCVINFSERVISYMNSVISRAAFGKVTKEQEAFVPHVKEIIKVSAGFSIADLFPSIKWLPVISGMKAKMERLHHEGDKIFESIINDHKARKKMKKMDDDDDDDDDDDESRYDLVDVLLKIQDDGKLDFPLTTNSIKAVILDLFIAGSETSSTVVEWAMTEMLKYPRVMEKAIAEVRQVFDKKGYIDEAALGELNYLKMVIKETLRLHPPLPLLLPRESRDQCEINGYHIPKDTQIIVNAWAIGRDPNYWSDSNKFDPDRFSDGTIDYKGANYEFIPFGGGRRICPGITFGIVNVEVPLANLLYHFDWRLPAEMKPKDLDTNEAYGITAKKENDLNLIPVLARSLSIA